MKVNVVPSRPLSPPGLCFLDAATFSVLPPHSREAWRRCPAKTSPPRRAEGSVGLTPSGGGRGRRGEAWASIAGAAQTRQLMKECLQARRPAQAAAGPPKQTARARAPGKRRAGGEVLGLHPLPMTPASRAQSRGRQPAWPRRSPLWGRRLARRCSHGCWASKLHAFASRPASVCSNPPVTRFASRL